MSGSSRRPAPLLAPLLALASLLGCAGAPAPRWEERPLLAGPPGATDAVACLAVGPGALFAAGNQGQPTLEPQRARPFLLVSQDQGLTWRSLQAGLGETAVTCLAVDATGRVLLAGSEQGVFRSQDGGRRWEHLTRGLPARLATAQVALVPDAPDVMLVASSAGELFCSQDRGRSWVAAQGAAGLPAALLAPSAARAVLHTDAGLFTSADQGRTWTRSSQAVGLPGKPGLSACAAAPETLCAVVWEDGAGRLIRSRDGGATWSDLPGSAGAIDVALDPGQPDTIYLLSARGQPDPLLISRDGGASWSPLGGQVTARELVVSGGAPRVLCVAGQGRSLAFLSLEDAAR